MLTPPRSSAQTDFRAGAAGVNCLRARQPALKRAPAPVTAAASSSAALANDPDEAPGFLGIPKITWKKIVPLGFMFFAILFNYTILRDTKVRAAASWLTYCALACTDFLILFYSGLCL